MWWMLAEVEPVVRKCLRTRRSRGHAWCNLALSRIWVQSRDREVLPSGMLSYNWPAGVHALSLHDFEKACSRAGDEKASLNPSICSAENKRRSTTAFLAHLTGDGSRSCNSRLVDSSQDMSLKLGFLDD
jgi:hypothetical protein